MDKKHRELWAFLFRQIDAAEDPETIELIEELLDQLLPILEPARDSIGQDLWLWIGLLHDSPKMAADYRKNFIEEYGKELGLNHKR